MEDIIENARTDFDLPVHDNELSNANDVIEKLRITFNQHKVKNEITDKRFTKFFEDIIRALDYVGRLSTELFEKDNEIEEHFKMQYLKAPELGKQLWLKYNKKIHHPYDLLKNRCHKLLEELDEFYIELYDKKPPNWKL